MRPYFKNEVSVAYNSHLLTQYISPLKDSPNVPAPGKEKRQLLKQQNKTEQDVQCEAKVSLSELGLEVRGGGEVKRILTHGR